MLTPRERERLIKQLWSKKHRDFRSTRGDETHPSILAWGPQGTTLVPLRGATDEELIALRDTGGLPGVGRGGAARKFPKGGPCGQYKTAPARKKCRARVSAKIGKLLDEGVPQAQAVATALSMESAGRLGPRGGYTRTSARRAGRRAEVVSGPVEITVYRPDTGARIDQWVAPNMGVAALQAMARYWAAEGRVEIQAYGTGWGETGPGRWRKGSTFTLRPVSEWSRGSSYLWPESQGSGWAANKLLAELGLPPVVGNDPTLAQQWPKVGSRATRKPLIPGVWNVYAGGIVTRDAPGPHGEGLGGVDIHPPGVKGIPWGVQLRVLVGREFVQLKFASASSKAVAERLAAQWTRKYLET